MIGVSEMRRRGGSDLSPAAINLLSKQNRYVLGFTCPTEEDTGDREDREDSRLKRSPASPGFEQSSGGGMSGDAPPLGLVGGWGRDGTGAGVGAVGDGIRAWPNR